MQGLLFIFIVANIVVSFLILAASGDGANFSFVNPVVIYRNVKVNWFGTILMTVIVNVIFAPIAVLYWFYKLCTVGR